METFNQFAHFTNYRDTDKSERFGYYLKNRIDNQMLDLKEMSIEELQNNINDYLILELYQYMDIDDNMDLSIESVCALLSSKMSEEDMRTFYLDLIIEVVNTINQTRRWKSIVVQMGQESGFKDMGRHYCFEINDNQSMEDNFVLLFHSIGDEYENFHVARR